MSAVTACVGAGREAGTAVDAAPLARNATAPRQGVLALAWPSLVENVLLLVMGMASLMMVGRLGPSAMAGVGLANQVAQLVVVVFSGLAVGNTALVARAVGAGRSAAARDATRQALLLGGTLSVAMAAVCFPLVPGILGLLGAAPEVVADGTLYLRAIVLTVPLLALSLLANGSLRGAGDTRTAMWVTGAENVANVAVAYPLIFGLGPAPQLGLAGAAWGLVAGRTLACVLSLTALTGRHAGHLSGTFAAVTQWRPDATLLRRLLAVGGPAAGESASIQIGMMVFSLMVIHMGTAAFAAQQVVFNAASLSMLPGLAFSVAATTLVGQHLGAGDPEGAARSGWRSAGAAVGWMSLAGLVFLVMPAPIIRLYTTDPDVIAAGVAGIRIVGLGQPLQAAAFVLAGALRGAGDTRTTLLVGGASMWGVRLSLAYTLGIATGWGLPGIWAGWCGDWCVRGIAFLWAFRYGRWKRSASSDR
jgi:putative MATE family efflux protein